MAENPTIVQPEDVLAVRSRVSWGAIFAGALLAFASYFILTLLGGAIGLSVRQDVEAGNLGIAAAIWAVLSLAISLFLGGYVTSLTVAGENRCEAMIHGVLVWSVMFAAVLFLATTTIRTGFSALLGMTQVAASATADLGWEEAARRAGIPPERITEWREQAARDGFAQTEAAGERITWVAWWTLFGVVISMACAVGGAYCGAGASPRYFGRYFGTTAPPTVQTTHHEVRTGL